LEAARRAQAHLNSKAKNQNAKNNQNPQKHTTNNKDVIAK